MCNRNCFTHDTIFATPIIGELFIYLFIYFSPSSRDHVFPCTGGLLLLLKATGAAREPTPRPFTTAGEPIPRTGRHRELNPGPLDLQTNALQTELTGRPELAWGWRFPGESVIRYKIDQLRVARRVLPTPGAAAMWRS